MQTFFKNVAAAPQGGAQEGRTCKGPRGAETWTKWEPGSWLWAGATAGHFIFSGREREGEGKGQDASAHPGLAE